MRDDLVARDGAKRRAGNHVARPVLALVHPRKANERGGTEQQGLPTTARLMRDVQPRARTVARERRARMTRRERREGVREAVAGLNSRGPRCGERSGTTDCPRGRYGPADGHRTNDLATGLGHDPIAAHLSCSVQRGAER